MKFKLIILIKNERNLEYEENNTELVCPMCAQKIETALQKVDGVSSVSVLYNASKAKVEFDENKTSVDELVKVITGLGYVVI